MLVRVQWAMGEPFKDRWFESCPRVDEFVMLGDRRFRVCQVQHREMGHQFVPHLILQEQFQ